MNDPDPSDGLPATRGAISQSGEATGPPTHEKAGGEAGDFRGGESSELSRNVAQGQVVTVHRLSTNAAGTFLVINSQPGPQVNTSHPLSSSQQGEGAQPCRATSQAHSLRRLPGTVST